MSTVTAINLLKQNISCQVFYLHPVRLGTCQESFADTCESHTFYYADREISLRAFQIWFTSYKRSITDKII
jgi:hypothetical protein